MQGDHEFLMGNIWMVVAIHDECICDSQVNEPKDKLLAPAMHNDGELKESLTSKLHTIKCNRPPHEHIVKYG